MTHTETTFSSNIPFFSVKDGKKSRNDHIRKIITHTPEVMVKITGFTHDFSHLKTHFAYIIRNGSLELEDALGGVYNASESIQLLESSSLGLLSASR
jgi:hypothetical protein